MPRLTDVSAAPPPASTYNPESWQCWGCNTLVMDPFEYCKSCQEEHWPAEERMPRPLLRVKLPDESSSDDSDYWNSEPRWVQTNCQLVPRGLSSQQPLSAMLIGSDLRRHHRNLQRLQTLKLRPSTPPRRPAHNANPAWVMGDLRRLPSVDPNCVRFMEAWSACR